MEFGDALKLVGEIILCSAEFEEIIARLYEEMGRRVENELAAVSLGWLSNKSRLHAKFLKEAISSLGLEVLEENCRNVVGLPWRVAEEVISATNKADRLDEETLAALLSKLRAEEGFLGIETYHRVLFSLLGGVLPHFIAAEDANLVAEVLREMSAEEGFHEEILKQCGLAVHRTVPPQAIHEKPT